MSPQSKIKIKETLDRRKHEVLLIKQEGADD